MVCGAYTHTHGVPIMAFRIESFICRYYAYIEYTYDFVNLRLVSRLHTQWHSLTRDEQAKYYEKARQERQLHMELYPGWSARDNYGYGAKKKKRKKERVPIVDSGGGIPIFQMTPYFFFLLFIWKTIFFFYFLSFCLVCNTRHTGEKVKCTNCRDDLSLCFLR